MRQCDLYFVCGRLEDSIPDDLSRQTSPGRSIHELSIKQRQRTLLHRMVPFSGADRSKIETKNIPALDCMSENRRRSGHSRSVRVARERTERTGSLCGRPLFEARTAQLSGDRTVLVAVEGVCRRELRGVEGL